MKRKIFLTLHRVVFTLTTTHDQLETNVAVEVLLNLYLRMGIKEFHQPCCMDIFFV